VTVPKSIHALLCGAAIAAFAILSAPALAQSYPTKPIRLIVPTPPGGPTDIVGRLMAERMATSMGQPVIVENKPGGAQMIAAEMVARSAPDGHTLLIVNDGATAINVSLYNKMPYDPQKDLAAVSMIVALPLVLVANPELPVKNVAELIALAKAKPGVLNFGSGGTTTQLAGELFKLAAGIDIVHVPYKGAGQVAAAVLSNEVQLQFDALGSALPHIKSGKMRVLGVTSPTRLKDMPDLPTIAETVPGYNSDTWLGFFVVGGTPGPIQDRIQAEVTKALAAPDLRERFATLGMVPVGSSPADFTKVVRADTEKWARVIREAKIPKAE
jgi:tripartite-type tricarboxylate transporter receptor subunit TctC